MKTFCIILLIIQKIDIVHEKKMEFSNHLFKIEQ